MCLDLRPFNVLQTRKNHLKPYSLSLRELVHWFKDNCDLLHALSEDSLRSILDELQLSDLLFLFFAFLHTRMWTSAT